MKIEWDEPRVPKRNADSLWTKVKNSISVIKQTHDGPPPRSPARGNSYGTTSSSSPSRSRSMSSHPRSSSSSGQQRSRSAGPPPSSSRPPRPYVTIATNGGPPQAIHTGQYGSAYVVQSPSPYAPVIYGTSPPSPSPMFSPSSSPLGARPKVVQRASVPYSPSPLRSPSSTPTPGSYTPSSTPPRPRPGVPTRSTTAPGYPGNPNGGVMYNGKLIVGDPDEVNRYISSQKSIEKWIQNVK